MNQGDRVRIVKVSERARAKVGLGQPRVGDIGIIRCAMKDSWQQLCGYLVDGTRPDGSATWMADFSADEVEVAESLQQRDADDLLALALAHARELVALAKANGHVRGIGDTKFCWISAENADMHAGFLRAEGLTTLRVERGNRWPTEHYQPISDAGFWAKLDSVRGDRGIAKLHFRMD